MNPISKTAYYCAGVRALDARLDSPLVNDTFAELLLGSDGQAVFDEFRDLHNENGSNITRHLIIDDLLRDRAKGQPRRLTVLLGAGFDTRAFRMRSGVWVELDEPEVIARKEALLPAARCPVPLHRLPIRFGTEPLRDKLAPFATDRRASVVMEGVSMYLGEDTMAQTARTLAELFPQHSLICDFTTERFFARYGKRMRTTLERLGARITWTPKDPVKFMESLGYRAVQRLSIPLRAAEYRAVRVPPWVVRHLLPALRDGYAVHVFKRA